MATSTKVAVEVEGRQLTLSNLDKVLYPEAGFTKGAVIDYYSRVAPVLLPHISHRPLTLKRYPDGVEASFFYEKNAPRHRPEWVQTVEVASPGSTKQRDVITYVLANDLPTLVWAANLADLEIHTPMWRAPHVGEPDLLVFDLDPGPPASVVECASVAVLLRPVLSAEGLELLPKTSGSKGMQLLAAVSGVTSEETSALAKRCAERLEKEHPQLVVSRMTKELRTGKVLVDWSQNNASKTTVAPYSLRARSRPTVSTPLLWEEVERCQQASELVFDTDDALQRIDELGDLMAPLLPSKPRARTSTRRPR